MPNRMLTRAEVEANIFAPYLREIAKLLREHPLKPGILIHIPGLFDYVGWDLVAWSDEDSERYAQEFEKVANDLASHQA